MMTALSGNAPVSQAAVASQPSVLASGNPNAVALVDRTVAPDTVTISAAGQQASQAARDMDHDGDSS